MIETKLKFLMRIAEVVLSKTGRINNVVYDCTLRFNLKTSVSLMRSSGYAINHTLAK